jgi:hypothetical protein
VRSALGGCGPLTGALAIAIACLGGHVDVKAQEQQRPQYEPMRSDEDWSVLKNPALRDDAWDRLKYVELPRPRWFLTLAAEARARYELLDFPRFGYGLPDTNGYLLQRYLVSTDWHFGGHLRAFGELQAGLAHGRVGPPVPTFINRLDLHQAFIDYLPIKGTRPPLRIRVGRQEMALGAGRLISSGEGLNVRRSFDGVRTIAQQGPVTWNAGLFRLVKSEPGFFDDRSNENLTYWGLGATARPNQWKGAGISVYYIGIDRRDAMFHDGAGAALRHTLGSRSWRSPADRWDFNHEVVAQWGTFNGGGRIRAWGFSSDTGFTFRDNLRTRIGIRADIASGDRHQGDGAFNSFDPLLPSAISYSGKSGLLGPTNLLAVSPTIRVAASRVVTVTAEAPVFWRQSIEDGIYLITTAPIPQLKPSVERLVGINPAVAVAWEAGRHVSVTALLSHFFVGPFLRDTTPGRSVSYVYSAVSYRF